MAITNAESCARYYAKKKAELKRFKRLEEDVLRDRERELSKQPKKPMKQGGVHDDGPTP